MPRGMPLAIRNGILPAYDDVLSPPVLAALEVMAPLDLERKRMLRERIERRTARLR